MISKKLHFITGLPRSGSTLLTALLKQNPRFHADIASPVFEMFWGLETATGKDKESAIFVSEKQRTDILKGIFDSYYKDNSKDVIFDSSRMWSARLPILSRLYPNAKFICCVREIGWIIDSFEKLYRKNGQAPSALYGWNVSGTVWSRSKLLLESDGVVGYAFNAVQEAYATEEANNRFYMIDYEDLCQNPEGALRFVYDVIDEPYYDKTDFVNFHYDQDEFDKTIGAPGLHTVDGPVEWRQRNPIIPLPLFNENNQNNFWRYNRFAPALEETNDNQANG